MRTDDLGKPSRRLILSEILRAGAMIPLVQLGRMAFVLAQSEEKPPVRKPMVLSEAPMPATLTEDDHELLEEIERAAFQFFWDQTNPDTGIVRDRFNVRSPDKSDLGSIAATGFGFTALCIGQQRGYVSFNE